MSLTPDQYFDLPKDRQRAVLQDCAMRMAPALGGQVAWAAGGDEVHVTGSVGGRSARLRLQLSFATMFLEVKTPRRHEGLMVGGFQLSVDPQARNHHAGTPGRQYVAPAVYLDSMMLPPETQYRLLQALPQPAQAALLGALSQFDRGFFMAGDDDVTLWCPAWVALGEQAAQSAAYYLNMLLLLSNDMDVAWRGLV